MPSRRRVLSLHPLALGALAVGLAAVATLAVADRAEAQATITNGVVQLGVDLAGQLNVCCGPPSSGTGTTTVGLRYLPTGAEATAPGCLCEGWGVSYDGAVSGYANNAYGGAVGMVALPPTVTGVSATTRAVVGDLLVTHDYHPTVATLDLYEATVTIANVGVAGHNNVEYKRVMDWDIEPTAFREFVTIDDFGAPPAVLTFSSNDGFATGDPLAAPTALGFIGPGTGFPFFDAGAFDHGAQFEFDFGFLGPGQSVTFNIYYGGAPDEATAYADLAAVGATLYSFGQPSSPGGPFPGVPNTFIFAFGGGDLGPPVCNDPALCPPPVRGGASCVAHALFVRETDLSGVLGTATLPFVTSVATAAPAAGAYAFSPFGPIPAPTGHGDAELADVSYSNPSLGVSLSSRDVHSWCDALAVADPAGVFTEAYGRAGLATLDLAVGGFTLSGELADFEAKAWGGGGTFGATDCQVTSGSFSPPPTAWTFPCPPVVLNPAPGVTLTLYEQFGPVVNAAGQDVYGGALAHLQVIVPGVSQVDAYIGYVAVAVSP